MLIIMQQKKTTCDKIKIKKNGGKKIMDAGINEISGKYEIITRKKMNKIDKQDKVYVDANGDNKYSYGMLVKCEDGQMKTTAFQEPVILENIETLRKKAGNKKFLSNEDLQKMKLKVRMFNDAFGYFDPKADKSYGQKYDSAQMNYNDLNVFDVISADDPKLKNQSASQVKYGINFDTKDGTPELIVYKKKKSIFNIFDR